MKFLKTHQNSALRARIGVGRSQKATPGIVARDLAAIGDRVDQSAFPPDASASQVARHIKLVDTLCIATAVIAWASVLTVAIACVVVVVMRGPAYVADAYRVEDAERPRLRR